MDKHLLLKKMIALLLIFLVCCGVTTEVVAFGMYGLPTFCVKLFQTTGISLESGMTVHKFLMQDLCVMFMMWIIPCLFITGVSVYLHAKLIKYSMRRVARWLRFLLAKPNK